MRKVIVLISYIIYAFKRIPKPHIGDVVKYNGINCMLIQGVANPYWDLLPMTQENMGRDTREIYRRVHVTKFHLDKSLKRKIWAFKASMKFKMQNWYSIDVRNSLFSKVSDV